MKRIAIMTLALMTFSGSCQGQTTKSALDDVSDVFALVTPDSRLGSKTRRQWLTLYPVPGKAYWAAWDCKDKACDTLARKQIRASAKLITRTDTDPKPFTDTLVGR